MGLAKVRPEDRKGAFAAFLTIFGILAGHTLLETARDALFLARLPASRLAFVYLAIAGVRRRGLAVALGAAARGRALTRSAALLGGGALVTFVFWLLLRGEHPLELCALYVWTGLARQPRRAAVLDGARRALHARPRPSGSTAWCGPAACWARRPGAAVARILSTRAPATMLVLAAAIVLGRDRARAGARARPRRGAGARAGRRPAPRSARACVCCAAIPTCARSPGWCSSRRSR